MTTEYRELDGFVELDDATPFAILRAQQLRDALRHQQDYGVVKILRTEDGKDECIIVDVQCDGVPSRNNVGIEYRERLALVINEDARKLVTVFALRLGFPVLIHQNQELPGEPPSLCLYYESAATVYRNWTPQNFLRRIQWWLEKSACGELHPADQPVEQLFFVTHFELVLPWNLDEIRKQPNVDLVVFRGVERKDGGQTFFLRQNTAQKNINGRAFFLELTLPALIHGYIEREPYTLGELADLLERRGVDLLAALIAEQRKNIPQEGVGQDPNQQITVILLHIPIKRDAESEPTRVAHKAYFISQGGQVLGLHTGALIQLDGTYFSAAGILNVAQNAELGWKDVRVLPVDVLKGNSAAAARSQSGIADEGPAAVLIGAGSLGSAMLNLWGRSGRGRWTVIDKDYIKPHNLSRHVASVQHIGAPKVKVVAELQAEATAGASPVIPIDADACDQANALVVKAIAEQQLVIDASTTLEYPRVASLNDAYARHISVFVTPTGDASVLLAEDAERNHRLRTLEAQYYRALIRSDWGARHHVLPPQTFWSGASCRDISMVMAYSKIAVHAATLAEQVQTAVAQKDARIRVWQRDIETGSMTAHDVAVADERTIVLDEYKIYIDEALVESLVLMRADNLPNETGGILLGYYDFNIMSVFIVDALPAPPDSVSTQASFERGVQGLSDAIAEATQRTAGIVKYIGEWHSHPEGHRSDPSMDDVIQITHLAMGMAEEGLPVLQLIVGDDGINVLQATLK